MCVSLGNTQFILGFYINYVVCKFDVNVNDFDNIYCFILTMWYVNFANVVEHLKILVRFILTMWYVNASRIKLQ